MRVLEYDFPLPPSYTSSPLPRIQPMSLQMRLSTIVSEPSDESSTTVEVGDLGLEDPACVHPVFIKSHLLNERGQLFELDRYFPVDQFHPACMGYFSVPEYQQSVTVKKETFPKIHISPPSENSIQRRRSMSISTRCKG
jgi:hypothetical protein